MPATMVRLLQALGARAWRIPALAMVLAFMTGWLLIYLFESDQAEIKRPLNYLWFFFVSATTTGYGDLFPKSLGGRVGGVLIVVSGLTAGLMLFAELALWMAKGTTLKANGLAQLHHRRHVVIIGYNRDGLRAIIRHLRNDPAYAKTPMVTLFWTDQLSGENPDPDLYDVIAYNDTAFARARLHTARTVLVAGRTDDETVRVMLGVCAYLQPHDRSRVHLLAGLHNESRREEIDKALNLIDPDIEPVDIDDPMVVAAAIRNPGVASIYYNLANLNSDATIFRVDIPDDAGEWRRTDLAIYLLQKDCTLLAVGESHRPDAKFRLAYAPDETVTGGQALAVVARERPSIHWHDISSTAAGPAAPPSPGESRD